MNHFDQALVFAKAADRKAAWQESLKEWNVKVVSQVVLEWQEQARGETWAEAVLTVLAFRFPSAFPTDLAVRIERTHDRMTLKRWLQAAAVSPSVEEFRRVLINGGR